MKLFSRLSKEQKTKMCQECGKEFVKHRDTSNAQWVQRIYCSRKCSHVVLRGRFVSKETRDKIRKSNTGKTHSTDTRKKLSTQNLGRTPWNKGISMAPETKNKLSTSLKGKVSAMKGRKHSAESNEKNRLAHIGRPNPNRGIKVHTCGPLNGNWKGGVSKRNKTSRQLHMETIEYKNWRRMVFERDNYTCVLCGIRGGKLNADHIKRYADFPELRLDVDNGRTLCEDCHKKTDTYGNRKVVA